MSSCLCIFACVCLSGNFKSTVTEEKDTKFAGFSVHCRVTSYLLFTVIHQFRKKCADLKMIKNCSYSCRNQLLHLTNRITGECFFRAVLCTFIISWLFIGPVGQVSGIKKLSAMPTRLARFFTYFSWQFFKQFKINVKDCSIKWLSRSEKWRSRPEKMQWYALFYSEHLKYLVHNSPCMENVQSADIILQRIRSPGQIPFKNSFL